MKTKAMYVAPSTEIYEYEDIIFCASLGSVSGEALIEDDYIQW